MPFVRDPHSPPLTREPVMFGYRVEFDHAAGKYGAWVTYNGMPFGIVAPVYEWSEEAASAAFCTMQRVAATEEKSRA